jgi:hypothetical protein
MSAFGGKADISGQGAMSAHSLPEPIIGYARAAMRRLLSSATFANISAPLTPSLGLPSFEFGARKMHSSDD